MATMASNSATAAGSGSILDKGETSFDIGSAFTFNLSTSNQVLTGLSSKNSSPFQFLARPLLNDRATPGFYHIGDIDLRWRITGDSTWNDVSSALDRSAVVPVTPAPANTFASADLTPSLALGANIDQSALPFTVQRSWSGLNDDTLVLTFNVSANGGKDVEFGGIGFAQAYYNNWSGLSIDDTYDYCVVADPAIHSDGGYIQINRVSGASPSLLVAAMNDQSTRTPLVQWRNIRSQDGGNPTLYTDNTGVTFTNEGHYRWMVATAGFTSDDENSAKNNGVQRGDDWIDPSSITVKSGTSRIFALRFFLSNDGPRGIQSNLQTHNVPVVTGVPSMVIRQGGDTNDLLVQYGSDATVSDISPANAVTVQDKGKNNGVQTFTLTPAEDAFGRVRITLTFADGLVEVVHAFIIKSPSDTMSGYGSVMTTDAYYTREDDYFGRYGVMTYDHIKQEIVLDANSAWIAGQGDEGGSAYMGVFMKQQSYPNKGEVAKLEQFLNRTIYGQLQYREGANSSNVRKSLFYYDANDANAAPYYSSSVNHAGTWGYDEAHKVDRAYNYPHVCIAWWSLYRTARYHQDLTTGSWEYYLDGAYNTIMAMFNKTSEYDASYYTRFGLMEGSMFEAVLLDLQREGWTEQANAVDEKMHARETNWNSEANPFGSEFPWDSTGQEEVYTWLRHYGDFEKADYTIATLTAIQGLIAHWAYGGDNRRYWDFLYSASLARFERMGHHYESALSAIPLLDAFRRNPKDIFLLQSAYAGLEGSLTGIQQSGAPSTGFHLWPDAMQWDAWSGDSALGMFGHLFSTGAYVINDASLGGWRGFRAEVTQQDSSISAKPTDTLRQRVFIASHGAYITLDAGYICSASFDSQDTTQIKVELCSSDDQSTQNAYLRIEMPAGGSATYNAPSGTKTFLGAYEIPLSTSGNTVLILTRSG